VLRVATALADYQNLTGQPVLLSWLGGEPLLWKPLAGLTKAVRALGLEVSATTNGTTLGSSAMRRHLCDAYKELTISVDGFSSLHDPMRGWSGGFEKLRRWVPTLAAEARAGGSALKLRANIVLMHQTIAAFPALCEELASWGIAELTFNQLGGRDRPEFYPARRLTLADVGTLEAQLPRLRGRLAETSTTLIGGDKYLDRIRASAMDEANPVEDCSPGESFLFIDERGRIAPCSFTNEDYAVSIDDIASALDIAALPVQRLPQHAGLRQVHAGPGRSGSRLWVRGGRIGGCMRFTPPILHALVTAPLPTSQTAFEALPTAEPFAESGVVSRHRREVKVSRPALLT
jgi:MoaA/NifB/PqqE/SkfB family radical SAM enzyme